MALLCPDGGAAEPDAGLASVTSVGRAVGIVILAVGLLVSAGCRDQPEASAPPPAEPLPQLDGEPPPAPALLDPAPTAPPVTGAPAPAAPAPAPPPAPIPLGQAGPGPAAPASPAALAAELARVEAAVRHPDTPASDLPSLGLTQQVAYRQLAVNPAWRPQVLEAVPAALHGAVVANADAELRLASMHVRKPTTFPKWRIVAPPPAAEVLAAHQAAGAQIGVPWPLLASIHLVETRMGRIRGTSTAGAKGPMQFLPATWAQYGAGGDIEDLGAASRAAARLLKRNGVDANPRKAVWNYNHSDAYVDAVLAYASIMTADPRAFFGYHGWQVFYRHASGDTLLPEGWSGV